MFSEKKKYYFRKKYNFGDRIYVYIFFVPLRKYFKVLCASLAVLCAPKQSVAVQQLIENINSITKIIFFKKKIHFCLLTYYHIFIIPQPQNVGGYNGFALSHRSVSPSVRPSPFSCPLYNS
jgi:hypothetical protein